MPFILIRFKHKAMPYLKYNCCDLGITENYNSSYRYSILGPFHALLAMWAQRWCLPHSGVNYLKILCLASPTFRRLLNQLEAATHLTIQLPAIFLCCQGYVSKCNKTILMLKITEFQDVMLCELVNHYKQLDKTSCFLDTLKMEAAVSYKMAVMI